MYICQRLLNAPEDCRISHRRQTLKLHIMKIYQLRCYFFDGTFTKVIIERHLVKFHTIKKKKNTLIGICNYIYLLGMLIKFNFYTMLLKILLLHNIKVGLSVFGIELKLIILLERIYN